MKIKIVLVLALAFALSGCDDNAVQINELPDKIIPTKPCETLYPRIKDLLPEYLHNDSIQSVLFADSVQKNIVLTRDTEVYLSFISGGAMLKNTFGWYSYTSFEVPLNPNNVEWHILFPHASNEILASGDRLQLGDQKFKKGTIIGFFLIADGWQNGAINYDNTTMFSTSSWNVDQRQQHVLFIEKSCGDIVLSFEDVSVTNNGCDHDFNDIIFTVADNNTNLENTSFEQSKMIKL